jgi:methylenetetrahydrofolate dehydrogenase (NADP+)/methenyltetrahydrofolate cyclohydrolase
MAQLIDGKLIGAEIREEVRRETLALVESGHTRPGLAVILVGDNPASRAYVTSKSKACQEAGFHSVQINLPATTTEPQLLQEIAALNIDPAIHGILVQLPLPDFVDEQRIIEAIDPLKDVDGFHPVNAGRLAVGLPGFVPCTPAGIRELLIRSGVETAGAFAVVVGRSNIVGKPTALLLAQRAEGGDATVVIAHSRTRNLPDLCRQADILVAAIGRPEFIKGDWIKPGATVIDVGINRVDDPADKRGYRLVGDVEFAGAERVAGAITPVPGGVGPMTIALLLRNTLESAKAAAGLPNQVR